MKSQHIILQLRNKTKYELELEKTLENFRYTDDVIPRLFIKRISDQSSI